MSVLLKCCLPFPGENPISSPRQIPLGTGRGCNAGKRRYFAVWGKGGRFALTLSALQVIPLHPGLQLRVGLCKPCKNPCKKIQLILPV